MEIVIDSKLKRVTYTFEKYIVSLEHFTHLT